MLRKPRLFTPGPTPLHPEAVRAMVGDPPHHRSPEFRRIFAAVQEGLRALFRTEGPVAVLTSSGTGAMEAAVANLFAPDDRVVAVVGGKFGRRWAEIAGAWGLDVVALEVAPGRGVEAAAVAELVAEREPVAGLLLTVTETSTGTAFDVDGIAGAVREVRPEIAVVADAITGVGALPVATDDWELDAVVGGSQKALMVPPGLGFVACSPRGWRRVDDDRSTPRYYFDLRRYAARSADDQTPFTPAIPQILALRAALGWIEEAGGVEALEANARRLAEATQQAAAAMGLELLSDAPSPAVSALRVPEPGTAPEIVEALRRRHGAQVAGGQEELRPDVIRLGHVGYVDDLDLLAILGVLESVLRERGHDLPPGAGVGAALSSFERRDRR